MSQVVIYLIWFGYIARLIAVGRERVSYLFQPVPSRRIQEGEGWGETAPYGAALLSGTLFFL
jgi:hypothetical protein